MSQLPCQIKISACTKQYINLMHCLCRILVLVAFLGIKDDRESTILRRHNIVRWLITFVKIFSHDSMLTHEHAVRALSSLSFSLTFLSLYYAHPPVCQSICLSLINDHDANSMTLQLFIIKLL